LMERLYGESGSNEGNRLLQLPAAMNRRRRIR
jgi:hypothetical protein